MQARTRTELNTCTQQHIPAAPLGSLTVWFFLDWTPLKYVLTTWPQPSQTTWVMSTAQAHEPMRVVLPRSESAVDTGFGRVRMQSGVLSIGFNCEGQHRGICRCARYCEVVRARPW